jgi:hypothetical protein
VPKTGVKCLVAVVFGGVKSEEVGAEKPQEYTKWFKSDDLVDAKATELERLLEGHCAQELARLKGLYQEGGAWAKSKHVLEKAVKLVRSESENWFEVRLDDELQKWDNKTKLTDVLRGDEKEEVKSLFKEHEDWLKMVFDSSQGAYMKKFEDSRDSNQNFWQRGKAKDEESKQKDLGCLCWDLNTTLIDCARWAADMKHLVLAFDFFRKEVDMICPTVSEDQDMDGRVEAALNSLPSSLMAEPQCCQRMTAAIYCLAAAGTALPLTEQKGVTLKLGTRFLVPPFETLTETPHLLQCVELLELGTAYRVRLRVAETDTDTEKRERKREIGTVGRATESLPFQTICEMSPWKARVFGSLCVSPCNLSTPKGEVALQKLGAGDLAHVNLQVADLTAQLAALNPKP